MNILLFLAAFVTATIANASEASNWYSQAMQLAASAATNNNRQRLYDHQNLAKGIAIPPHTQWNQSIQHDAGADTSLPQIKSLLGKAAEAGSADAALALGDMYMYGNFSQQPDYKRALEHYEQAIALESSGRAYFMSAFIHSTGVFGALPIDKQRANLYYELAARNNDTNALLVLAYRKASGIGCPVDCATAQFYYSRIARSIMQQLADQGEDAAKEPDSFDISVADFNGGLYGNKISESPSSVMSLGDRYASLKQYVQEKALDSSESYIFDYYFEAVESYYHSFFFEKDHEKAFNRALRCAYFGGDKATTRPESMSDLDKSFLPKCQSLVGSMYLNGEGVERNFERAYRWLKLALDAGAKDALLGLGLLHQLDPTSDGQASELCKSYLKQAATNGSEQGLYFYSKLLVAGSADPLDTTYSKVTYEMVRKSAANGNYGSLFYFSDAIEAGISGKFGETIECPDLVLFYKSFVDRSNHLISPHLTFAFEELSHGNFQNALIGYSIAAEQGFVHAQISTAYLLHQQQPLFSWNPKPFDQKRFEQSLVYLEQASAQGHVDATVLLGDFYAKTIPGFQSDYKKAFAYYSKAASAASPHACYKLAYMYEHGMGFDNNAVDYYMAKRYYDLSMKSYQDHSLASHSKPKANTYAIGLALLRLKLKALFGRAEKNEDDESSGWFNTLKKIAGSEETEADEMFADDSVQYEATEEYQLIDYVVLLFTLSFFIYVGVQNIRGHLRGRREQAPATNLPDGGPNERPNRFQFEFFFAI